MPEKILNCPLCDAWDASQTKEARREVFQVACRACGEFEITEEAKDVFRCEPTAKAARWCVSAATRRAWDADERILITTENWRSYVDSFVGTSVAMKARMLLETIHAKSDFFGESVEFSHETDWPTIAAKGHEECWSILCHLQSKGFVAQAIDQRHWCLTWSGWEAVEPAAGGMPGLGFVAMAFRPDLDSAFNDGILPAIETDCALKAIRVDREHFQDKICDRIIVDIRRAQFVVADFTYHRGGVYFEAGYALALGRTVIWCCREDQFEQRHFDTHQYQYIVWREPTDLRLKLRDRLRALVPGARLG